MKAGLLTSSVMHVVLIGFGLVSLSAPRSMEAVSVESLPIEIVPFEEITQVQVGEKTAPMSERPAPLPTQRPDIVENAQNVGENTVDTTAPATPDPKPRPVETAALPPPPPPTPQAAPRPEPKPEPQEARPEPPAPKPEPRQVTPPPPQPAPTPVAEPPPPAPTPEPAPVVEAKPEPAPEPTPTPPPQPADTPAPAPAETAQADASQLPQTAPRPEARPQPPQAPTQTARAPERSAPEAKPAAKPAQTQSRQPSADNADKLFDDVAALLNREKPSGGGARRSTEQASLGGERRTGGERLSQGEMDALRQRLGGCWSVPAGVDDANTLKVSVRFRLDRSGSLEGRPEVVRGGASSGPGRIAAESAVRAVQKCEPFNLPADKYETWAEIVVNFDPTDMF